MSGLLATLPVQLACTLITPGNHGLDNSTPYMPLPQQAMGLPNGYTAFLDIGLAMKFYTDELPWNLARKHCIMEGGNLAVIDSIKKGWYAHILRNSNPRGPLLGIHKLYDPTEWISDKTGLPLAFIPWVPGLDRGASAPSCTALYDYLGGRVGHINCDKPWTYMCEVPIPQIYTSEVQPAQIKTDSVALNESLQYTDSANIGAH